MHKIDFDLRKNEAYLGADYPERTLLMWATLFGQHALMVDCLKRKESAVNEKDAFGYTALHFVRLINEKCT